MRTLLMLAVLALPQGRADARLVRTIEQDICINRDDDPLNTHAADRLERIEKMGERGRRALLQIAATTGSSQACALGYLGQLDDRRAIPSARRIVASDTEPVPVLAAAVRLLAGFRDLESESAVLRLLQSSERDVFVAALDGAVYYGDDRAKATLRDALEFQRWDERAILVAIGRLKDAEAISLIVRAAQRGDDSVKHLAVLTLLEIGSDHSCDQAAALFDTLPSSLMKDDLRCAAVRVLTGQSRRAADVVEAPTGDAFRKFDPERRCPIG